jgi:3-phenylpropionate/trans-cinnamate dioxygenase ferredoxin reductase subunit
MTETMVIVGAGLAGAKAAESLRANGFAGRLVLVGAEQHRPYERPQLSKKYLLGEATLDTLYVHPADYYDAHGVELVLDETVTGLDVENHRVLFRDREAIGYTRALLATGSAPRRLAVPGADLPGVLVLRTMEDASVLRDALTTSARVVVVGAGWIGCEVASAARTLGAEVAIVAPEELPLVRVLGPELGAVYRDVHREHGVDLRLGTGLEAIVGIERAEGVMTSAGEVVHGDVVVLGVGAAPRDELAREAGLVVGDGVVVDEFLRTSAPDVFAAGDIASAWNTAVGARLRVEHWANAIVQGRVAGANMAGANEPWAELPYFYSDQYDLGMEYRGHAVGADRVVVRGDLRAREFLAFWLRAGVPVAAMNVNVWDQGEAIEGLLQRRPAVDAARLADPAVPLVEI